MKSKEEQRMSWSEDEYEAMVDLATRQLAERMAKRALITHELYDYNYLDSQFVADFIAEFVISGYASYLIKPENLNEEAILLLFVNMAYEIVQNTDNFTLYLKRWHGDWVVEKNTLA